MRLPQRLTHILLILGLMLPHLAWPASKLEIDARVRAAMEQLYAEEPVARELGAKASGILVFPRVIKVGIGIGGEAGQGSLLVNGQPVQYYRTTAASFGFQLGGQAKSEVIMFMTQAALEEFRASDGSSATASRGGCCHRVLTGVVETIYGIIEGEGGGGLGGSHEMKFKIEDPQVTRRVLSMLLPAVCCVRLAVWVVL